MEPPAQPEVFGLQKRPPSQMRAAFHTGGNLLLLSTDKQIDDFSIQIKDAQGHIVYTEAHLSLPAKGVYPILIGDWTNGLYTVTLCQDGKYAVYQFTK